MKHILLPDDFSDNAHHAMDYAFKVFGFRDVTFHLFYTYAIPVATSELAYAPLEHYEKEGEERIKKEIAQIKNDHPDVNIEHRLEFGDLPTALRKVQSDLEIDCIVMGTRGSSGIKEVLFGSNTYDVVDNTEMPVIVVPEGCDCGHPVNIVLSSDLKPLKDDRILDMVREFADRFKSKITVLNVKEEIDSFTLNAEMNHFDELFEGIEMTMCFDDSDHVVEGLEKYVKDYPTDLLVAIKRKKNFLADLFSKSVTKDLTFHLNVPLLILHD
jgi:nucleotide-binding universal stress UspA family protein